MRKILPVARTSKILVILAPTALQYFSMSKSKPKKKISRRKFLKGTGVALAVATTAPKIEAQTPAAAAATEAVPRSMIRVTVNGTERRIEVEDRWTLVELLRDHLGL